jgi:choline dehydrogenase-like flavoprotein
MTESTVAIVGSGFAGTVIAQGLAERGADVAIFEKGPPFAFPHQEQYRDLILHRWRNPKHEAPVDLQLLEKTGTYGFPLNRERALVVGGAGTHWSGITLRMRPQDFRTKAAFGFGDDWPVDYAELEPYYGRAEAWLGVSGTDADNPFAPPRSTPYPLPPFELGADDRILADRLARADITLHSTPQARAREAYDGRAACVNFGVCHVCPIGARFSPNHHLQRLVDAGRVKLFPNTSVRRVLADPSGRGTGLLVQGSDEREPREHGAKWIVVAGGAIETIRLLLLSKGGAYPDGIGHRSGWLGRGFVFHHSWWNNELHYDDDLYAGRFGGFTGQCQQFLDPETRGRHGGLKIEFTSHTYTGRVDRWGGREEVDAQLARRPRSRSIILQAETTGDGDKSVTLSSRKRDRFGDPAAHVTYRSNAFDHETFLFARTVHDRFVRATGARAFELSPEVERFGSGAHHMSGARMSVAEDRGVVDAFGRIHGSPNIYVVGSSTFVGTSGSMNPTLTLVALAFRTADRLADQMR